ncbi:dihydrolipoyl dehydrogenase family protein [Chlamydiota bacterium]
MMTDYDLVIIGGGAAGLFTASVANRLGAKTCLIDKTRLGGDCTWYGCMPSKTLLKSASIAAYFKKASEYGLEIQGEYNIDTSGVMDHVQDIVNEIASHHPNEVFEKRGITVIIGAPQFVDSSTIRVNNEQINACKFVLCPGSHPMVLPIDGLDTIDYLTNETVFDLKSFPESLIVLGGGPIGIELSQALSRLGVKVSIVEMMDRLLFREEKEASEIIEKKLHEDGVAIYTGKKAVKFAKNEEGVICTVEDKEQKREEINGETVLVAIGRAPNVEGLALEKAGIDYSHKGVIVNEYLQTTNESVFACGDVVGPYQFSHVAAYQASVVVRNALFRKIARQKVNYTNITWATFTDPEVARLGMSEEEARGKNKKIKVYSSEYTAADRAITDAEKEGLVKVITNKKGFIMGATIIGASAGELMQGFSLAKSLGIRLSKLGEVMYIYPTLSELVKKTAAKALVEKLDNPMIQFILKIMKKIR